MQIVQRYVMKKIVLLMVMVLSLAFGVDKPTGCELSQIGDVQLSVGEKTFSKVGYKAIAKSGKNFHAILVGSTISVKGVLLEILDIKADKRVRGKPRTGDISVKLEIDKTTQKVAMKYSYDKGLFSAKGLQKNGEELSFALEIEALLCHAK